jgi:uncharacterized Zn-binding protein involved in type VI secretion
MMAGEIIRMGDKTSHGGTVIEGSGFDICMGKPIAYIGHKVQCPKCKGVFPIIEGALTTTFYGKGVALAGMRTACGAVLLAGQFTDIVEYGGGSGRRSGAPSQAKARTTPSSAAVSNSADTTGDASSPANTETREFDDKFVLQDADTGQPVSYTEYAIRRASGEIEFGTTDADGHTHLLSTTVSAELIEIYV